MSDSAVGDLIAVVQVFRHGQRAPMPITYPTDPYKGLGNGLSELTNTGKRQIYELGQYTRSRYQDFLPTAYSKQDFQIYTTEFDRTNISAQLFCAGLYPPTDTELWNEDLKWNPIPTNMTEQSVFRAYAKPYCPTYAKLVQVVWDELLEKAKKDPIVEYIVLHSGIKLNSFLNLGYLHDALVIQESLGLKLPEWTEKVYSNMPYRFDFLKSLVWTDQLRRLAVGRFYYELLEHFKKMASNPTSGQKMTVYSGHDSNVYPLISTLGVFKDDNFPEYASAIFFELKKKHGECYVNICYLNGGVQYPITIPGGDFDCKLTQFRNFLSYCLITQDEFYGAS